MAAHIAVREMVKANIFRIVDIGNPPNAAAVQHRLDLLKKRRIAKHVSNGKKLAPLAARAVLPDAHAVLRRIGDGFFQQDVVPGPLGQQGRLVVHAVLGADKGRVRQSGS